MRTLTRYALSSSLLLAACSNGPTPSEPLSTPTNPPPATASPTPTAAPGATGSLVGSWTSASCGERAYPRQITFAEGGTFQAADLVSPCPPKVVCVWSGIINYKGRFAVSGSSVTLTVQDGGAGPGGRPFPTSLGLSANGAPLETADGKSCTYAPQPNEGGKK
jgi:hypothetical protein